MTWITRFNATLISTIVAIAITDCGTNVSEPARGPSPASTPALTETIGVPSPTVLRVEPVVVTATPARPVKRVMVSEQEVIRGPADRPQVSLVINAGAGFTPAEGLLDVLASRGVHTTFFLMGWWVERNQELVQRIQAAGHEIASHGHSVFDLTVVSDAEVVADLQRADDVISAVTAKSTKPLWSPSAGYRDVRVRRLAAQLGFRPILWSHDSGDWRLEATAEEVRQRALAGAEPGAIIVLHLDSSRSRSATLAVLGDVIDAFRMKGLEPVTITDLIGE